MKTYDANEIIYYAHRLDETVDALRPFITGLYGGNSISQMTEMETAELLSDMVALQVFTYQLTQRTQKLIPKKRRSLLDILNKKIR